MKNFSPLISIIVPVYNTGAFLESCIESLLCQTYENFEIILIDDGSTDETTAICDMYANNSRIKVIHQINKGVSVARNRGMDAADGGYLVFVDSDDRLVPDALELFLKDAYEYNADVVSAAKISVDEKGKQISSQVDGKINVYDGLEPMILSLDYQRQTSVVQAKLFRRNFVDRVRFIEDRKVNEDGYFIFQCYALKPKLVQHNIAVYVYTHRKNSSSKIGSIEKYYDILFFGDEKEKFIRNNYPELIPYAINMQVSTNIFFLYILCRTNEKKYLADQKKSIDYVKKHLKTYKTENNYEKKMAMIIHYRLYGIYKFALIIKRRIEK